MDLINYVYLRLKVFIPSYIHTITPVFPEGLGRGIPMYTHSSPVCLGPM